MAEVSITCLMTRTSFKRLNQGEAAMPDMAHHQKFQSSMAGAPDIVETSQRARTSYVRLLNPATAMSIAE
ncbi:hypothetical protein DIE18_04110 [Burkholderia sp. Bp9125]|nr:hypothetical protein DIE18_04110 [Burkholderia sp. Bp9125]